MEISIVYVREEYFIQNNNFIEMLDPGNLEKQSQRKYMYLESKYNENRILVPLRSNIPDVTKLGNVAFPVPTMHKSKAGIDYRKVLVVNDDKYIERPNFDNIPRQQKQIINDNYEKINGQINKYISGYIKSVKKNRHLLDKKYCFSTLHNFHKELGIIINTLDMDSLKVKIDVHKDWLQSNGEKGKRLVLKDKNLTGLKFYECDLRNSEIVNCDLTNCIFYADLSEAIFNTDNN